MSTLAPIGRLGWRRNGAPAGKEAYAPPFSMFLLAGALNWNTLGGTVLQNALRSAGFSVVQISAIAAVRLIPTMTFLLWGPLVDGALTRRHWYAIGAVLMGLSLFACYALPWSPGVLGLLAVLVFAAAIGRVVALTALKGIIASKIRADALPTASGWYATGQGVLLGAVGAGSLWLVAHLPSHTMAVGISLLVFLGCASTIALIPPDRPKPWRGAWRGVGNACVEAWRLLSTRKGLLATVVFLVPVGSSYSASFLAGAVAKDWGSSPDLLATLAMVEAVLNGVAAIVAGRLCRAFGPWRIFLWSSVAVATVTLACSIAPRTPGMFACWQIGSSALGFAHWTSTLTIMMTLSGGRAAATKAAVFTSIVNIGNAPLTFTLGAIHDQTGPSTMVLADAAFQLGGFVLIYGAAWLLRVRPSELETGAESLSDEAGT